MPENEFFLGAEVNKNNLNTFRKKLIFEKIHL